MSRMSTPIDARDDRRLGQPTFGGLLVIEPGKDGGSSNEFSVPDDDGVNILRPHIQSGNDHVVMPSQSPGSSESPRAKALLLTSSVPFGHHLHHGLGYRIRRHDPSDTYDRAQSEHICRLSLADLLHRQPGEGDSVTWAGHAGEIQDLFGIVDKQPIGTEHLGIARGGLLAERDEQVETDSVADSRSDGRR